MLNRNQAYCVEWVWCLWLAMIILFYFFMDFRFPVAGSEYLEYISSIRIMHNNGNNHQLLITKQLDNKYLNIRISEWNRVNAKVKLMHNVQYTVRTVKCTHKISWTIPIIGVCAILLRLYTSMERLKRV